MSNQAVRKQTQTIDETIENQTTEPISDSKTSGAVIGVFDTHVQAEHAIKSLEWSGFPIRWLAPLDDPHDFQYDIPVAEVAVVWRHGSVIGSWLLDLTAEALLKDPQLTGFHGQVADSGEGRWSAIAAVESGAPALVIAAALFGCCSSRDEDDFADRVLSAMRYGFGGHEQKAG